MPAPYPMYYPPPKKNNTLLIVVIIIVIFLVATPVMAAVLYLMVSGLISGPTSSKPIVAFTAATLSNGIARFSVAGATSVVAIGSYRVTMTVNSAAASSPVALSSAMAFIVDTTLYRVNYTDISGTGNLKTGDEFRVMSATYGPLPIGRDWSFLLIWAADGSLISTVSWST